METKPTKLRRLKAGFRTQYTWPNFKRVLRDFFDLIGVTIVSFLEFLAGFFSIFGYFPAKLLQWTIGAVYLSLKLNESQTAYLENRLERRKEARKATAQEK